MYRITFFVIFSFLVSILCVQELVGQPPEGGGRGQRGQGQFGQGGQRIPGGGGQRPAPPVQPVATESGEQTAEGEEIPAYVPPPLPPENSLSRIVDPAIADHLRLNADQRNRAFQIINTQAMQLSNARVENAPNERFSEIYQRTEEALSNLLTATQRAVLEQGLDGKTYIVVFHNQRWEDVLQWIADQGGFTLLMTAPPPGTFTYTDREPKTILEVLDLVNGILITDGYTLVRRDRILQLLDLRRQIPTWSFPTATVQDLAGRASSEFVSVTHNWGRRPASEVLPALEPLRSNNRFMRWYPSGGSVTVIDRVEIHRAIQRIINGITEPPPPPPPLPQPPRQPDPPPPVWQKHTVEKNDPETIIARWREFVPNIRLMRLEGSKDIHVNARPAEHEQLAEILKMLEEDSSVVQRQETRERRDNLIVRPVPITPYFEPQNVPIEAQRERLRRQNIQGAQGAQGEQGESGVEEEEPDEPAPIPPPPPANSFARIIDPAIAEKLAMTPAQRNEAQRILMVQTLELQHAIAGKAPEEYIKSIYAKNETALSNLLTEAQRAMLDREFDENKIRIVSNNLFWGDALRLIAEQAGLRLILTATPPGTFNYNDREDRTLGEALQFLNELLITDAYTILRHPNTLQVIHLRSPNPDWIFPPVTVEDLPKRAPNEFVSVTYSFGRRPAEQVMRALEGRKKEFTRVIQLGTHVMVIDRVERQNAIPGIIQGIGEPERTPRQEQERQQQQEYQQQLQRLRQTPSQPRQIWTTYTFEDHNTDEILRILQQNVSGIRVMRQDDSPEVHIYGAPNAHSQIVTFLKMFEDDAIVVERAAARAEREGREGGRTGGGETTRRNLILVPYSITPYFEPQGIPIELQRERLLRQQSMQQGAQGPVGAPGAQGGQGQFGGGQFGGRQPGQGRQGGGQFGGAFPGGVPPGSIPSGVPSGVPGGGFTPPAPLIPPGVDINQMNQMQMFGLELIAFLRRTFPDAIIADTPIGDRLMIRASEEDHQAILDILESFKPTGENRQGVKIYQYTEPGKRMTETTVQMLQALVPGAMLSFDAEQGKILAVATAREHEVLAGIVKEFEASTAADGEKILHDYQLTASSLPVFESLVSQLAAQNKLPGYVPVRDSQRNQVLIWATAEQHELIQPLYAHVTDAGRQDELLLVPYPVAPYFEAQVPIEIQRQRLRQASQVGVAVEGGFPTPFPGGFQPGFGRGQRQGGFGPGGVPLPAPVIPQGVDINQLNQMQMFALEIIALLKRSFPDAVISDMPISDRIIIRASESDHERIAAFLEQLKPTGENQQRLQFYSFTEPEKKMTETTLQQLQAFVPNVALTLDAEQGKIMAVATAREHEALARIVREIEAATAPVQENMLKPYRLSATTLPTFTAMVQQLASQNKLRGHSLIEDAQRNQVLIWATAEQHELIQNVHREVTGQTQRQPGEALIADAVVLFTPRNIALDTMLTVIEDIYPTTRITTDAARGQMIIRVRPEQKEPLESLLAQLDTADPEEEKRHFKAYPVENVFYSLTTGWNTYRPMEFQAHVEKLVPRAQIMFDSQSLQLIVWGTDEEHAIVEKAIRALIGGGDDDRARTIERISLRRMQPFVLSQIVRRIFPVEITPDGNVLIVEGHPRLLPKVKELIDMLDPEEPTENDPVAMFYKFDVEPQSLWTIVQGLQNIVPPPRATYVPDARNKQIMVIARPADQKLIERSTDLIVASFKESEREIQRFEIRRFNPLEIGQIVQRRFPEVIPTSDWRMPGVLIVEGDSMLMPKVAELIEAIDPLEPTENDAVVVYYSLKVAPTWELITGAIQGLQQLAPAARISNMGSGRIMVVARPTEQEIIKKNTALVDEAFSELEREVRRIELNRMPYWQVQSTLQRLYPTVQVTYNTTANYLVVEAFPELMPKIVELVEMLDPAELTANDPLVKFYALKTAPTPEMLQGLRQVAPFPAQIIPDQAGRRIMVFAKPAVHKQIEASVDAIVEAFEEPVLVIYEASREERVRLEAFMMMAAPELREVRVIPEGGVAPGQVLPIGGGGGGRFLQLQPQPQQGGGTPTATNRITIWARPTEHELIATVLKQIRESQANIPDRELKSFPMSVADLTIAQNILQASIPDAMLFPDPALNRLMVWATPGDMKKVTDTLLIQGSIDDREMMVYPVAGVPPETLRTVILEIFQGLKITAEARRILVWATPEEHGQIAQIVEEANKEVDPESELAEKFVAYSAVNIDVAMVLPLFQSLIPEADVHAAPGSEKIVVRAIARDHTRIEELFTQLREKDESLRLKMMIYQFGETDPVMIEALLRNQLKEAESLSPDDLVMRVSYSYYRERMNAMYYSDPWYMRQMGMMGMAFPSQTVKVGYYNVDPQTRSVQVFATEEQHEIIREAIEQIVEAANQPGLKLTVQRYALNEVDDLWTVQQLVQRIAPSALLIPLYEEFITPQGWYRQRSTGEFLAYTYESEHEKLDTLIKELNDKAGTGRKEMLTIALPENTPFSRERVIETIQRIYTDITPMPGGTPNQILVWAPQHRLEQVQKIVDDIAQPLPVGERTIPKSYPLQFISVEEATAWLGALYPNVLFNPDDAVRPPFVRPDAAKFIVAVATPLEHIEIAKTIEELDKDLPDTFKMMSRAYTVENMPLIAFQNFYATVTRLVPNAVLSPFNSTRTIMVVASEEDHRKVSEFVETYREDVDRLNPYLEVYTLKRQNYHIIAPLLQRIAPGAFLSVGATPQQVTVWGTSKEQTDIADTLAKLETAAGIELDHKMVIYKTGTGRANIVQWIMSQQFPGAVIFPLNQNELFVWGAPSVHEAIEPSLEALAGIFPEPELKPYFFKHIELGQAATIIQQAFAGQAISITPRADDLLVFATPDIHEKIAASIANFDIPRPEGTETYPKIYDLGLLTPLQVQQVAAQLPTTFGNRIQVLPSAVPGHLTIMARQADHEKVETLLEQMLEERPDVLSPMRVYTIHRATARASVDLMIRRIVPSARIDYGANPNQLLVWTRESEHAKVKDIIDRLNESDADMSVKTYYFKHVSFNDGWTIIQSMFTGSATLTPRVATGELIVFAASEVHEQIAASIASFDIERPEGMDMVPRFYDVSDLPADAFLAASQQIQLALQYRVRMLQGPAPGQMIVWARLTDHEKVEEFVKQVLVARTEPKTYDLSLLTPLAFDQAFVQIQQIMQGRVQTLRGAVPGQLIVVGRQTDLVRVDAIIEQMLDERPDVTSIMKVYTVHRGNARATVDALIRQIIPNVRIDYGANPNQLLVWTRESEHVKVKDIIDRLNESDADMSVKTYYFNHVSFNDGWTILQSMFMGSATFTPRVTTGELMVFAASDVHDQIAASIAAFDVERSTEIEITPRVYDVSDLPADAFFAAAQQIRLALQYRVTIVQSPIPGQMIVWARPADHAKVDEFVKQVLVARTKPKTYDLSDLPALAFEQAFVLIQQLMQGRVQVQRGAVTGQLIVVGRQTDLARVDAIVEQILGERSDATSTIEVYTVNRGNVRTVIDTLIRQIAPTAVPYPGQSINQVVVWAKAADHVKIESAIDRLNEADPDVSLRIYQTGVQRVSTAQSLLLQQFPGLLVYPTTPPSGLVAWATSAEHATISDLLETVADAYPDPVLKPYYFKHVPINEGMWFLTQTFAGQATIYQLPSTGDMLVYAAPDVHERIEASVAAFDVPRPRAAESLPRTYDLSGIPQQWLPQAQAEILRALQNRVQVTWGISPGQMIIYGKEADLEKVDMIVSQMLDVRPEATAEVKVYTVQRLSNMQDFRTLLPRIAPTAQAGLGSFANPSQILIWAKADDHAKIKATVEALNESEPDITMQLHPLKNIDDYTASTVLDMVITGRGLDVRMVRESFANQLVVLASPENQIIVAEVLDSLRTDDREFLHVQLNYVEPDMVRSAILTMFADEAFNVRPFVTIDLNMNTILVLGFPYQLERIAKTLREMGESVWYPEPPPGVEPGGVRQQPGGSNLRTIHIQGNPDMLRQLQQHWQQSQPNPLHIIAPPQPQPPQEEESEAEDNLAGTPAETTSTRAGVPAKWGMLFSLEDEIQRDPPVSEEEIPAVYTGFPPSVAPVFVLVNPDGSLTVSSEDTAALDQLESLLRRISSGIIAEGRDFTVYAVPNISANVVAQRLMLVLRDKLIPQQTQTGAAARPRLILQVDQAANSIYVQGSRADRQEVGRLITQFSLSSMPGEAQVLKPVPVIIENTTAARVLTEVLKAYQQRLMTIQLPGGQRPQIIVNDVTNALEIFAPEPLLSELKEYIEEVDRRAQDEPGRKIQVIPVSVKASIIEQAIYQLRQPYAMQQPYGMMMPMMMQPMMMQQRPMQQMPMQTMPMQTMPMQQMPGVGRTVQPF